MKNFEITWTEYHCVRVHAENEDEAHEIAKSKDPGETFGGDVEDLYCREIEED